MGRVLLVDDEPEFLEVLQGTLNEAGFDTVLANGGLEALAIVKQNDDIDCILTDYFMPEMRGDELALSIKHDFEIPIMIMTGDPSISFEKIYNSGVSGILAKPIDSKSFIEFLKTNDIHLGTDLEGNQRKFLRQRPLNLDMKITVTNGQQSSGGKLLNLSAGGLGIHFDHPIIPISTVGFTLEKGSDTINGYMHCRWKTTDKEDLRAGFEFDSITKRELSKNDVFKGWIKIS